MTMLLRVFDVEHGACTILGTLHSAGIAMIDCGHNVTSGWRPSTFLRERMKRSELDFLLVTNADQDHISDLSTLHQSGISIKTLISNTSVSPADLRWIKELSGPVTKDAEALLQMRSGYGPVGSGTPFDQVMGGITIRAFLHAFPAFINTNDLSAAYFIKYGPFQMLFPGDLEKAGWKAHLQNAAFLSCLRETTILVASHHGRESGFCEEVFQYLRPQAVVISDKPVIHESQEVVPKYRGIVINDGIRVTNETDRRHVLTTRCDGDILFRVEEDGNYTVTIRAD